MISKAASMVVGALCVHLFSEGLFPVSRAAWSWGCTYYEGGKLTGSKYISAFETGPKCADSSTLNCTCPASPCKGRAAGLPSCLIGAGDDADTSGCYKLHHVYGTPPTALAAVAGRAHASVTTTDACGAADIIKVYGDKDGLDMLVTWQAATTDMLDKSAAPNSAQACQKLCAANADCKFFTYNDQGASDPNYKYFNGMCILQKALTCTGDKFSTFHGVIAGPSACPDGVTIPAAPTTAPTPAPTAAAAATTTAAAAATTAAAADSASSAQGSQRLASFAFGGILLAGLLA